MATYRNVQISFWTDSKVSDDFTPEDRYFYLYLFTNPHTNLCGCYEVSLNLISYETGYSKDIVERLIERFEKFHQVICYSRETKEILLLNWHKYNWTKSDKFLSGLDRSIRDIKDEEFRRYLSEIRQGKHTVPIPYTNSMDTTLSVTDTFTDMDTVIEMGTGESTQKVGQSKKEIGHGGSEKAASDYGKNARKPVQRFDEFWSAYPLQKKMLKTRGEYAYVLETTADLTEDMLISAAENYAEECRIKRRDGMFITHPDNWLRESAWMDYLPGKYQKPEKKSAGKVRDNNNFQHRQYDFEDLESQLLGK